MRRLILLASLALAAGQAQALSKVTGNELSKLCSGSLDEAEQNPAIVVCVMYVAGVLDGHEYTKIFDSAIWTVFREKQGKAAQEPPPIISKTLYCPPNHVTHEQEALIVKNFLTTHPERLHEPAASLILNTLRDAFPCK